MFNKSYFDYSSDDHSKGKEPFDEFVDAIRDLNTRLNDIVIDDIIK